MTHTLMLDNLTCAHCASKIEETIARTEGFRSVSYNFATKKLRFEHDGADLKAQVQQICDSIEDGVRVCTEDEYRRAHEHEHEHEHHDHHHCHDGCCDGHDHDHDHDHGHGEGSTLKKQLLAAAVILGLTALTLHLLWHGEAAHWTVFALSLSATLAARKPS